MTKRMLIDDTQPEETRVVIVDGNKVEDVEFESSARRQIKGNIYTAKVIRVEPSLQAAFVDYGGNRHGFLAFGEIHPDYYHVNPDLLEMVERETNEIIERKKQYLKEREEQRERWRAEKQARYEEKKAKEALEAQKATEAENEQTPQIEEQQQAEEAPAAEMTEAQTSEQPETQAEEQPRTKRRYNRRRSTEKAEEEKKEELKVLSADSPHTGEVVYQNEEQTVDSEETAEEAEEDETVEESSFDDDDFDADYDFELQRKLIRARKLYHYNTIQDVIKEGQTLLIQVVKEERGNKGAACTTYLSLAGRYCVLMPNRIKSGGVSRKITDAADRKRLKEIMKTLPLTPDMSMIIRTAGEDKTKADIVRDYNFLIRTWNHIRLSALKNKVPSLIYEEGDLIKRALRDMYTKDIAEVIVDGQAAFKTARDFVKILSPHNLKKIKCRKPGEMPVFQRYQVETQLDKLHNPIVQLESGGYLVINPTEALVAIDVNSGRATREKDIEETALKTNLEAADEIAKQLKMRNLAGLIVVDFIDMEEPQNNHAVEKRMKEALKNDRSRIQVAKMSCFGLIEISRQRMHSSFIESNYVTCPHCHGQGVVRTTESGAMLVLRAIEEEGTKNRSSGLTVYVPSDTAFYLLNQKRTILTDLEARYKMEITIASDDTIMNVSDYRFERTKASRNALENEQPSAATTAYADVEDEENETKEYQPEENAEGEDYQQNRHYRGRRSRFDHRRGSRGFRRGYNKNREPENKEAPVLLYSSDKDINISSTENKKEGKTAWWRKLIG